MKTVFFKDEKKGDFTQNDTISSSVLYEEKRVLLNDNGLDILELESLKEKRKDTFYRLQYWKGSVPYGGPAYDPQGMEDVREQIKIAKKIFPELDSVSIKLIKIK